MKIILTRSAGVGLALAVAVLACGCGGGGSNPPSQGGDTTAPTISNPQVNPSAMSPTGGNVTIQATVTDNVAVGTVQATVTTYDSQTTQVAMTKSGNTYTGTYVMPPLTSYTPQAGVTQLTYQVSIGATDTSNNAATPAGGSFTVPVPPATP